MKKSIKFDDREVYDILADLSETLNVSLDVDHNEHCLRIPEALGSGYIKCIQFDHGLGVLDVDCLLHEGVQFEILQGNLRPLKIIFNREHAFKHRFKSQTQFNSIEKLQSIMVSGSSTDPHIMRLPSKVPICIFSLEINRKLFEEKTEQFLSEMNDELVELFQDVNGVNRFFHKMNYSLDISELLKEFTECELSGFTKAVFQEGKAYELLSHQLRQYLEVKNSPKEQKIVQQAIIEKVNKAVKIIKEEIASMDSVVLLARRVGINQNTLQSAFKQLHNASVNEYIRNYRIERAKEYIEKTDLNITEICYEIGINSRSYFARLFKEKYGVTPKIYADRIRRQKVK
ncbi:helix-turn-helix transcriptional regulator [Allomuricauda sp. d1]|uniref:helix-turn-helix transcriptional regulator n=1 Tax=Allomuricauda sp. d1 TaxID=3136725 RepID=UPI0031E13CC3